MTVFPGFGGQKFIEEVLDKAHEISQLRKSKNYNFLLEVDGGVGPEHIQNCLEAGVDIFVAGTAYFKRSFSERQKFAESVELST